MQQECFRTPLQPPAIHPSGYPVLAWYCLDIPPGLFCWLWLSSSLCTIPLSLFFLLSVLIYSPPIFRTKAIDFFVVWWCSTSFLHLQGMVCLCFKATLRDTITVDYDSFMKDNGRCCPVFMGNLRGPTQCTLHNTNPEERDRHRPLSSGAPFLPHHTVCLPKWYVVSQGSSHKRNSVNMLCKNIPNVSKL